MFAVDEDGRIVLALNPLFLEEYEIWQPITRYGSRLVKLGYHISSHGRIRNSRGVILKTCTSSDGYSVVRLPHRYTGSLSCSIHRLVAEAFIPNPEDKPEVNHKNGKKKNNRVSNLEWMTRKENINHAFANGLYQPRYGERNNKTVLNDSQVIVICEKLQEGWRDDEIIDKLPFMTKAHWATLRFIRKRSTWTHISCNYKWDTKGRRGTIFTEEELHTLAKLIAEKKSNAEIIASVDKMQMVKQKGVLISDMRAKRQFKRVCDLYF